MKTLINAFFVLAFCSVASAQVQHCEIIVRTSGGNHFDGTSVNIPPHIHLNVEKYPGTNLLPTMKTSVETAVIRDSWGEGLTYKELAYSYELTKDFVVNPTGPNMYTVQIIQPDNKVSNVTITLTNINSSSFGMYGEIYVAADSQVVGSYDGQSLNGGDAFINTKCLQ